MPVVESSAEADRQAGRLKATIGPVQAVSICRSCFRFRGAADARIGRRNRRPGAFAGLDIQSLIVYYNTD